MVEEVTCPKCESIETRKYGWKILAGGRKAQMFQCKECGSYFRSKGLAPSGEPYHYVRFRWWNRVDLEQVEREFSTEFDVEKRTYSRDKMERPLHRDEREEVIVRGDTLTAMLSSFRAILSQKQVAPFTGRDVKLRKKVLDLYSQSLPTPFPWSFTQEPKFETA